MQYALIESGMVKNLIIWDGPDASPMEFGEGISYVEIPDGDGVLPSLNWTFDGKKFTAPPLTEDEIAIINEAAIAQNVATKQSLMDIATLTRDTLQDAVDEGIATDEESALLPLWKKYRILLSRINSNTADDISWPAVPA